MRYFIQMIMNRQSTMGGSLESVSFILIVQMYSELITNKHFIDYYFTWEYQVHGLFSKSDKVQRGSHS